MIARPRFESIPLAAGLRWSGGGGWCYQEKLDGQWHELAHGSSVLVGELVGESFTAFDVPIFQGQDVRHEPLRFRLALLHGLQVPMVASGQGGEFLEAVLTRGGEGVVAKHLDAPFGVAWVKCKRQETHDCIVTEIHEFKNSIRLGQWCNGQMIDRGWCPAFGRKAESLAPGDVVEVRCHSIHASGKFREPALLRLRPDKKLSTIALEPF
jgi:bifunctional non-homologous end joining protein LigD